MKAFFKLLLVLALAALLLEAGNQLFNQREGGAQTNERPVRAVLAQTAGTGVLLVNASHPLPEDYAPEGLMDLYGEKRLFQLASSDIRLARVAFEAANRMFKMAKRDGVDGFILSSGYRTEEEQQALFEADTEGTAAKPGTSEHQTGLAFDVTAYHDGGGFDDTEQFRWLSAHSWDYGFILRYPEGKEDVTGIPYEPWHYRYVGVDIAREIQENGWTLEEYCERNSG